MTDRDEKKLENVVEGVEEAEQRERGLVDEITLSTGVVLKVKPVPKHFIFTVTSKFEKPKVPVYFNEKKGREEENPNDPDYAEAVEMYVADIAAAAIDVVILRGTEIISVPKDFPDHNSKEWKEEMAILGLPLATKERARYLAWIKGMACPLEEDITILMEIIGQHTGVSEADTAEAVERFRRTTGGNTD